MTKIRTTDAARRLGIHPAHLLQHIAALDASVQFGEVWPEVDDAWLETIAATGGHRTAPPTPAEAVAPRKQGVAGISQDAIRVLDKLTRQGKWGKMSVSFEALRNLTHIAKRDLERALAELTREGLLDHDGSGRGTISLASGRRKEIERVVHQGH